MNRQNKIGRVLVSLSLTANIFVLIAVCLALIVFSSSKLVIECWGPVTPGRGILLSVYVSILVASILLLSAHTYCTTHSQHVRTNRKRNLAQVVIKSMVAAVLSTQVLYKITTPATAGVANPVVISNLCISALHAGTLFFLWRDFETGSDLEL